jgi:lactoylglutathione lyase
MGTPNSDDQSNDPRPARSRCNRPPTGRRICNIPRTTVEGPFRVVVVGYTMMMVKFGYTIMYVPDVAASLRFFNKAFQLPTKFLHDGGDYGELDTGSTTTLAFCSHELGTANLANTNFSMIRASDYNDATTQRQVLGMSISLVTDDVSTLHASALSHGATEIVPPSIKPWGQTVSYIRAPDGTFVELCTPVGGSST